MAKIKLAAVRVKEKELTVQIKMNRGPNHTLRGERAQVFIDRRNAYRQDNNSIPDSDVMAANDFLNQRLSISPI